MSHSSLVAGFVQSATKWPERFALDVDGIRLTYRSLGERALATSKYIHSADPQGLLAAVLGYRSVDVYVGVLGVLLAGKGYVPLSPKFPAERNHRMLEESGARVLYVSYECENELTRLLDIAGRPLTVILQGQFDIQGMREKYPDHQFESVDVTSGNLHPLREPDVHPDAPAYVLFTSGSTGTPKGVAVSHRNVTAYVDYMNQRYGYNETDRVSQAFALTFDVSVHDMFVTWASGGELCCVPDSALMAPAWFIREKELTAWFSVPSVGMLMSRMKLLKPNRFPTLRFSFFAGEALPALVASHWQEAAPNSLVENLYGPTEATITITGYRWDSEISPDQCLNGIVPIGHVFPEHQVFLLPVDEDLPGVQESGELCLAGPQVTTGYMNDEVKTAEQFVRIPGEGDTIWYRTGDLVSRDASGCIYYRGRIDHQVKVNGHRVELLEVEHTIRKVSGVETAVAVAWPIRSGHAEGIIAFVSDSADPTKTSDILSACAALLPAYMVPQRLVVIDNFPLNASGKIDRRKLTEQLDIGSF